MTTTEGKTIVILYLNFDGDVLASHRTDDDYTPEECEKWAAWLNDDGVEHPGAPEAWDQYDLVSSDECVTRELYPTDSTGSYCGGIVGHGEIYIQGEDQFGNTIAKTPDSGQWWVVRETSKGREYSPIYPPSPA